MGVIDVVVVVVLVVVVVVVCLSVSVSESPGLSASMHLSPNLTAWMLGSYDQPRWLCSPEHCSKETKLRPTSLASVPGVKLRTRTQSSPS